MAFKHENEIDMDQVASFLKDAVTRVKTEEDPEVLNELKKVYKQNVPFSLRMYVAAYLVKQSRGGFVKFGGRRNREDFRNSRDSRRDTRRDARADRSRSDSRDARDARDTRRAERDSSAEHTTEPHEHLPRVQIDPALATTIFVGIGRNRRVYPRDLVGLLVSVGGLDRERIGDIRVLANYSFIQLFTEDADKAINALNGYDYRGRKLSVSFSRQKGEGEEEESVESSESAVNDSVSEQSKESVATEERVPNVKNVSAPIAENNTKENADTVAQQAAFAKAMESAPVPTDAEIAAARAPRSSSSDVAEAAPASENN